MRNTVVTILFICLSCVSRSQQGLPLFYKDTVFYEYKVCKMPIPVLYSNSLRGVRAPAGNKNDNPVKKNLFTVSGDMTYQYFWRDAPSDNFFLINSSSDIALLRLRVLYKEKYPYTVSVRYNRSKPFQLDNQYEVNFGFDNNDYRKILQDKLRKNVKDSFLLKEQRLTAAYEKAFRAYQQEKAIINSPGLQQQNVEERLREYVPRDLAGASGIGSRLQNLRLPSTDNIRNIKDRKEIQSLLSEVPKTDSLKTKIADSLHKLLNEKAEKNFGKLLKKKDSLQQVMKRLEDSAGIIKERMHKELDSVDNEIAGLKDAKQLKEYASKKGINDSLPKDRWADRLMKTQFRLGKFILRQSELTVNNIFIHGASIRYGDEKFVMLSGGFYDFAFRDLFNFRSDTSYRKRPTVYALKIGKGDEQNLRAFNFYIGRKSKEGSLNNDLHSVAGYSVEQRFSPGRNLSAAFEIAKSTTRENNSGSKQEQVVKDLFTRFSTATIGIFGTVRGYLPKTKTDGELTYKYWGQQFESFNATQYFNPQNNISAKVSQPFFNRKLFLATSFRYTNFNAYSIANNIKTRTLFASAIATMRLKKLPVVSLGFYPGSQLYLVDQSKLYEYYYYILNATITHQFTIGRLPIQGVFTYNKFLNRYSDSLVKGAQSFYSMFWTTQFGRFGYLLNGSRQELENALLLSAESGLTYTLSRFRIGASIKWNRIDKSETRFGYSANASWTIGNLGTVSLLFDRSYLPERTGVFIPVQTGQLQIVKPLNFKIWH